MDLDHSEMDARPEGEANMGGRERANEINKQALALFDQLQTLVAARTERLERNGKNAEADEELQDARAIEERLEQEIYDFQGKLDGFDGQIRELEKRWSAPEDETPKSELS